MVDQALAIDMIQTSSSSLHVSTSAVAASAASPPHRPSDPVDIVKPSSSSTFSATTLPPSPPTERSVTPMAVEDFMDDSSLLCAKDPVHHHHLSEISPVVSKASDSGIDILASSESAVDLMLLQQADETSKSDFDTEIDHRADAERDQPLVVDSSMQQQSIVVLSTVREEQDTEIVMSSSSQVVEERLSVTVQLQGESQIVGRQMQSPVDSSHSEMMDGVEGPASASLSEFSNQLPTSATGDAPQQQQEQSVSAVVPQPQTVEAASYAIAPFRNPIPQPQLPQETPITAAELKQCKNIVAALLRQNSSWPFRVPVDPVAAQAPDYFTVILNPMDLSTVQKKLSGGHYQSVTSFVHDVRLMFDNCFLFNPSTNIIHGLGLQLECHFANHLLRNFPHHQPMYHRPGSEPPAPPRKIAVPKAASKRRKSTKATFEDGFGDRVVATPAPIARPPVDTGRPTRERKPKKFYEPDELPRRSMDDLDQILKRRRSIGKGSGRKKGRGSDSDSDDDEDRERRKVLGNVAKIFKDSMEQLATGSSKKSSKKKAQMLGMMTAMMGGLIQGTAQNDDSSSDSGSDSDDDRATTSAPRKKSRSGVSSFGHVPQLPPGSVLVDNFDEPSANVYDNSKRCEYCGTSQTPMWRKNPSGKGSLCNKCGVKARHGKIVLDPITDPDAPKKRRKTSTSSASSASRPLHVSSASVSRTITEEQKHELSSMIDAIPEKYTTSVLDIIKSGMPSLSSSANGDEIELDMNLIDPPVLARLYDHVKACLEEEKRAEAASKELARLEAKRLASDLRRDRSGDASSDSGSDSD